MASARINRREALRWLAGNGLLVAAASSTVPRMTLAAGEPRYRDAGAPVASRVRDLLSRMTLEEKVAQMLAAWGDKSGMLDGLDFSAEAASENFPDGIGQLTRVSDKRGGADGGAAEGDPASRWRTPQATVRFLNALQRWAINDTRLGIPVLVHEESLHGYMASEATMFPQAIAMAGTFDPELVREINSVIAREVRARGVTLVLSPVVDIVRDPRWGRIEETFGEDPHLAGEMGIAAVEGLQGPGKFEHLAGDKVYATLKHMTGHGQPASGNNVAPAQISERELRENFFPPFREIVERTSIGAVMPSYNEIDGVPSHANTWLLGDVLREEWGFEGVVVSDYNAIDQLQTLHHVTGSKAESARRALAAGVDCELPDGDAYKTLADQVREGTVDEAAIDTAVGRILELKFRSGLFESPFGDVELTERVTGNYEARDLALTAARKSLCLLTNDGTLPLDAGRVKTIAVVGPNAAVARLGGYSSVPRQAVTLLDGIRGVVGRETAVLPAQGVYITQSENRSDHEILLADRETNLELIDEAVEIARDADVIVVAIGDTEQTSREAFATYHLGDRTGLDLVGEQNELFDALQKLGRPVVVCAINGRPPSWPSVARYANALLECWYPGQEGGTAMAEALFGIVNPGAKLPVTVVREEGQVPYFYNHKPTARRGYLFADKSPLFPFGHGLSYTEFEFSVPRLSASTIGRDSSVTVSVDVTNTGDLAGDEVVQVYVRDRIASLTRPVKSLQGFERITLAPGETRTVIVELGPKAFSLVDKNMRRIVEPGVFDILVGPNSVDLDAVALEIVT